VLLEGSDLPLWPPAPIKLLLVNLLAVVYEFESEVKVIKGYVTGGVVNGSDCSHYNIGV
jgi:hypothetical protein